MKINTYKKITECRICKNSNLQLVIDLGEQYLTGIFPKKFQNQDITKGPLRLVKCHGSDHVCGLLQLEHSYDLSEMYGDNYGYRSGLNASMISHLSNKVDSINKKILLKSGDLVIDIGSNDGTTLGMYPKGLKLVGVDPTAEKFRQHYGAHIDLIPDFFSEKLIRDLYLNQKAMVITSFSMFYDLEDPVQFAKQIAEIIDPQNGIWVFEQSYMPLMLERIAYDTICHEHLEFYGLEQIIWIANKSGLKIIDVELNDINGGSFSVTACHESSHHFEPSINVATLLRKERNLKLNTLKPYEEFASKAAESRNSIRNFILDAMKDGKTVYGIGASTKGNVLLQYCGLTDTELGKIGDVNLDKHGSLTPGTWIPIVSEQEVLSANPDYLIVLPWHFRDFFLTNPKFKGRKLVFPLPDLEIIEVQ